MMDNDDKSLIAGMIMTCIISIVFGILIAPDNFDRIQDLGQAIYEQEYDANFVSYIDGTLKCSDPVETTQYDGIKIMIGGGENE